MTKRISSLLVLLLTLLCLCSCSTGNGSTFSIQFIDVGQGDSALVECDGHYMLIDGGDTSAGSKVYNVLQEQGIQQLDILAVSHLHKDHIGGLIKALTYATDIDITLGNSDYAKTDVFRDFEHELRINGSEITIPNIGSQYALGSAAVEVIDVSADENNDSLVLMVTYGDTRFLFTGDIEEAGQTRISNKFHNDSDTPFKIDLIKMPHHGAYTGTLYQFLRTFMPDHVVVSVGANNQYGHPDAKVLDMIDSKTWKPKIYRTDKNGDIFVKSNGKTITVATTR